MRISLNNVLLSLLFIFLVIFVYTNRRSEHNKEGEVQFDHLHEVPVSWYLPWFFKDGNYRPDVFSSSLDKDIWPTNASGDRIVSQLMYVPDIPEGTVKKIYVTDRKYFLNEVGGTELEHGECPVGNCVFTRNMSHADAVVFKNVVRQRRKLFPASQIWIIFLLESPIYSAKKFQYDAINWTATYRTDSDIVTPYAKWVYYDENVTMKEQNVDYSSGKSRKIAWIVSNCHTSNRRMEYALELQKFISVDIYGSCGTMKCPRSDGFDCYATLSKQYKFYLSFENGNCIDYITEKFYRMGLGLNMIPIVMGARREDYKKMAPFHSYIHVEDFKDAEHLAEYLHTLDKNNTMYNSYFQWKGTGEFIHTHFFCRLCSLLNSKTPINGNYKNFTDWWNKPGTCVKSFWGKRQ